MTEWISLSLGALSLVASVIALWIARGSDRRMEALSDLQFQEKLAVMAGHLSNIKRDKSSLRVEMIRSDFDAAPSLKNYTSKEKQEKMIRDYMIPILNECLSSNMEQGIAIAVKEIIDTALSYQIDSSELETLRQRAIRSR